MSAVAAGGPESAPPWSAGPPVPPGLQVVHADDALLVFDKPAGLLAVPGRGEDKQDCLAARAQAAFPDALVVHRLDMDGFKASWSVPFMARGLAAPRTLNLGFEKRQVHKQYVAVVQGLLAPPETDDGWGLIDLPLILDWLNRPRSIVDHEQGRPSRTRWRVLAAGARHRTLAPVARAPAGAGPSHRGRSALCACPGNRLYQPPAAARAASGTVSPGHRHADGVRQRATVLKTHLVGLGATMRP